MELRAPLGFYARPACVRALNITKGEREQEIGIFIINEYACLRIQLIQLSNFFCLPSDLDSTLGSL